jgi:hypothetical protein
VRVVMLIVGRLFGAPASSTGPLIGLGGFLSLAGFGLFARTMW